MRFFCAGKGQLEPGFSDASSWLNTLQHITLQKSGVRSVDIYSFLKKWNRKITKIGQMGPKRLNNLFYVFILSTIFSDSITALKET